MVITCTATYAQRSIGGNSTTVNVTQGVSASQVSDSLTEIRTNLTDSIVEIRLNFNDSISEIRNTINSIDVSFDVIGDTIPPFVYGVLEEVYPTYSYNQLKTIRQNNWTAFKNAVNWQKAANGRRVFIPNLVEMHVNNGEEIVVGAGETAIVYGNGEDVTKLYFYPRVKSYSFNIFDCNTAGSSVTLKHLYTETTPLYHETYNAIARPGGITNQITITDPAVHTGANFVGKTVNVATTNTTTPTPSYTITGYNSTTKTLTVSGTIALSDNDVVYIATPFTDSTSMDSILIYGKNWLDTDITNYMIYAVQSSNTTSAKYLFEHYKTVGFDITVYRSSGNCIFEANNSTFTGHQGSIYWYSNNETDNKILLNNVNLANNCFVIYAYIKGSYSSQNLYGSAIYSHPNATWEWNNVNVYGSKAAAVRQYTAGSPKPISATARTILNNCVFYDNDEYTIQSSQDMPMQLNNCYIEGTCFFNNKVLMNNCVYKNGIVTTYESTMDFKASHSSFENTYFNVDAIRENASVTLENCTIQAVPTTFTFTVPNRLHLYNCRVTNNSTTPTAGVAIFNYYQPRDFKVINTTFEDTDTPLYWRFGPYTGYAEYIKSQYKQGLYKDCTFYYDVLQSGQVTHYNNLRFVDCLFNTSTGSTGRWTVKAAPGISNTVLSGTTVSVTPNNNAYYTAGSIDKITVGFGGGIAIMEPITFTAKSSTTFTRYDSGTKTTSNLDFPTVTLATGESVTLKWNPLNVKATGSTTVTALNIGTTASGTQIYVRWGTLTGGSTLVPGSMTIVAGGVTFVDDGFGNLSGTGGSGWVDYQSNTVTLTFDSDPSAGNILATYQYYTGVHQQGMWERVD